MQGMHRGEGFGEISGRAEADGGRHDGEGLIPDCDWKIKEKKQRAVRVTKTEANQASEEAAGNVRTEEMITGVENE